jgi:response regulator RpfG family c-di-GMP phosphodiesterase
MTTLEALEYLREQSGILFDPKIIDVFEKLVIESQPDLQTTE